jgi:hypothetical protein
MTSRAKTFEGTVIHPDAIFASSSTFSLYMVQLAQCCNKLPSSRRDNLHSL